MLTGMVTHDPVIPQSPEVSFLRDSVSMHLHPVLSPVYTPMLGILWYQEVVPFPAVRGTFPSLQAHTPPIGPA